MIRHSHIPRRSHLALHLNELKLTGTAVEIGVYRGDFSAEFLELWKGKQYHLVDPWNDPPCVGQLVSNNKDLEFVTERFKDDPRVTIHKHYSEVASFKYIDETLDFVYIDADHTYESIYNDLVQWWPKIRSGGIMAGHDIFVVDYAGVTEALIRFSNEKNTILHGIFGDRNDLGLTLNAPSWYMYK